GIWKRASVKPLPALSRQQKRKHQHENERRRIVAAEERGQERRVALLWPVLRRRSVENGLGDVAASKSLQRGHGGVQFVTKLAPFGQHGRGGGLAHERNDALGERVPGVKYALGKPRLARIDRCRRVDLRRSEER